MEYIFRNYQISRNRSKAKYAQTLCTKFISPPKHKPEILQLKTMPVTIKSKEFTVIMCYKRQLHYLGMTFLVNHL